LSIRRTVYACRQLQRPASTTVLYRAMVVFSAPRNAAYHLMRNGTESSAVLIQRGIRQRRLRWVRARERCVRSGVASVAHSALPRVKYARARMLRRYARQGKSAQTVRRRVASTQRVAVLRVHGLRTYGNSKPASAMDNSGARCLSARYNMA